MEKTTERSILDLIRETINMIRNENVLASEDYRRGYAYYISGNCQIMSQGKDFFEVLLSDEREESVVTVDVSPEGKVSGRRGKKAIAWDSSVLAALFQIAEELGRTRPKVPREGKVYTREGMMKRVLEERREKAAKADYRIEFADNIYGEHTLVTDKGTRYKITLRDFENETGYINNPDLKTNKLGTTKHVLFAFRTLKEDPGLFSRLDKTYPFVEIYLDPLNGYKVSWYYLHTMDNSVHELIDRHFKGRKFLEDSELTGFLQFLEEAPDFPVIKIRPEVEEKVKEAHDQIALREISKKHKINLSKLKLPLFPYQVKGVEFATFREGAVIADEMGLGKTVQAIGTAVMKKEIFGFRKTLLVCPASLKEQWKLEIEKFCDEEAVIAEGMPDQRAEIYKGSNAYFIIVNYETVLRDLHEINRMDPDFVILDEAQRIKNYTTNTAYSIKKIKRKHALVITGTPIENRLIDLYSIVQFVNPGYLAPLWEFSYQHCYFDLDKTNKITGYYNLQNLKKRMKEILIRREKHQVISELPNVTEVIVPVELHEDQVMYHAGFAKGIAAILRKKFMTPYDQQRLMLLLNNMRMVCDSTFLIDKETYISPKLMELKSILVDKLDILNSKSKIIIFSEWVTMLSLIGNMLREQGIGYVQLSGQVAVKNRGKLIKKFENDPFSKVFLSSEAGGTGLNLQVADTVINFELPWNPAKKNQRLGRIDRLGQKNKKLTMINLVSKNSIETKIASGLSLKQNLFDSVLNDGAVMDTIDFSSSGRAQFIRQLEKMMQDFRVDEYAGDEAENLGESEEREDEILPQSVQENQLASQFQSRTHLDTLQPQPQHQSQHQHQSQSQTQPQTQPQSKPVKDQRNGKNGTQGPSATEHLESMEKVMNHGMEFLAGLYKMSTGENADFANQKIEVDKETGEVVMRFKIPGLKSQ